MRIFPPLLLCISLLFPSVLLAMQKSQSDTVLLFSSFRGNGQDGLHLAYSTDALKWHPLNGDRSVLSAKVGNGLMRDPCIIKGPKGVFHMVWTSGWQDKGIGIAHSEDLITWSKQTYLPVMQRFPTAKNAWAPEIFWDKTTQKYVIFWASTLPGRYPETEKQADKGWDHRIYAVTTTDFKTYSEPFLFFEPGFNVIDATLIHTQNELIMLVKDETRYPPKKNLHVALSEKIDGPWSLNKKAFSPADVWVEGPTAIQFNGWYYVYFDKYIEHEYGAMRTQDFLKWQNVSAELTMPEGMRHGSVLQITRSQLDALIAHFQQP